jgi:coenzyme F420-reducing hydrogenase alpha subunit
VNLNTGQTILAIVGGIVILVATLGGLYAIFQASAKDAMTKRLQSDNTYLRGQLDFIEPRFREAESKNEMLIQLHNPTARLDSMSEMERRNHEETVRLLTEQKQQLDAIHQEVAKGHG